MPAVAPAAAGEESGDRSHVALDRLLISARAVGTPDLLAAIREAPDQCSAAAFFDALIGQQDRHSGNLRWDQDAGRLGLFDHGFTFKRPRDLRHNAAILLWRLRHGDALLQKEERVCLERVLAGEFDEILELVDRERADAVQLRAAEMLAQDALVLP